MRLMPVFTSNYRFNLLNISYEKTTSVYPFFEEPGGEGFIKKCFMLRQDLLNNLYRLYNECL